ncbi:MAG: hypothetical protein PHY15_08510 [Eubacteriales bacterium]|nr:hypothetical protein [Eubacteriales bacterium]
MIKTKRKLNIGAFIVAVILLMTVIDIIYDKAVGNSEIPVVYTKPAPVMTESEYKQKGAKILSKLTDGVSDDVDLPDKLEGAFDLAASYIAFNGMKVEALLSTKGEVEAVSEGLVNKLAEDMRNGVTYEEYRESFFDAMRAKTGTEDETEK